MKIGLNDNWFVSSDRNFVRIQLGPIGLYFSKVRLKPNGGTQGRYTLRMNLLERDGWRCRHCGKKLTYETMTIHHIKPKRTFPELAKDPDNLVCLCGKCHHAIHAEEHKQVEDQIREIYRRLDTTVSVNPCALTAANEHELKAIS